MKTIKIIIVAILAIVLASSSVNQLNAAPKVTATKVETLKVSGNCGMCKSRIETAAKIDGVSKAEWNSESKILSVTLDPSKATIEGVGKKVAAAGHDTEKVKADDKTYSSLPGCCKYR